MVQISTTNIKASKLGKHIWNNLIIWNFYIFFSNEIITFNQTLQKMLTNLTFWKASSD